MLAFFSWFIFVYEFVNKDGRIEIILEKIRP